MCDTVTHTRNMTCMYVFIHIIYYTPMGTLYTCITGTANSKFCHECEVIMHKTNMESYGIIINPLTLNKYVCDSGLCEDMHHIMSRAVTQNIYYM